MLCKFSQLRRGHWFWAKVLLAAMGSSHDPTAVLCFSFACLKRATCSFCWVVLILNHVGWQKNVGVKLQHESRYNPT